MKDLGKVQYQPIGECIYCANTNDLRKEHILPFGLSGTAVLPKSTCGSCATITSQFERELLRGPMRPVRILRKLKSRRKHKGAPRDLPLTAIRSGEEETVKISIDQYPILLHFPIFPLPAYIDQSGYTHGIQMTGNVMISFGPRPEEVARQLGVDGIKITQEYSPVAFARLIAKIAYAFAVAEGALKKTTGNPLVLPAILGKKDDIGRWVGTLTSNAITSKNLLHRFKLIEDKERGLLMADVQLFSDSQTPSYLVIIGKLQE